MNFRYAVISAMLLISLGRGPAEAKPPAKAKPKTVKVSGCVVAGREAGCRVLRDLKTHELYSLYILPDNDPGLNVAIRLTGMLHEGPVSCPEGKAVEVVKWKKLNQVNCDSESGNK